MPHPGSADRARQQVHLRNAHPVPPGVHHDVQRPVDVTVTLRWETGDEQLETVALEWWPHPQAHPQGRGADVDVVVRVRIADPRVMTGAIWLSAGDVRRR